MTLIVTPRDHAKNFGLIANEQRNNWKITNKGIEQVEALCRKAPTHDVDVTKCFLWSPRFKALLDPSLFHRTRRPAIERNIVDTSESTCANDRGVNG